MITPAAIFTLQEIAVVIFRLSLLKVEKFDVLQYLIYLCKQLYIDGNNYVGGNE